MNLAFRNLFWLGLILVACSSPSQPLPELQTANQALQAHGFTNLRLVAVVVQGDNVRLDFRLGSGVTPQRFGAAFDTALRTVAGVLSDHRYLRFSYRLEGSLEQPLQSQALVCPGAPMYTGYNGRAKPSSLAQARVLLNPGHGWYLRNGTWLLQRPIPPTTYVQEDSNNLNQAIAVRDALAPSGATVWAVRELDKTAGNGVSGYPKWQEAAKHYMESKGVPERVWNSERDATDGDCAIEKDIRSRALLANYLGADVLIGLHTNASDGRGRGTLTFYSYEPVFSDTPSNWATQSEALARAIHAQVVAAIQQARPDLNWPAGQVIGVPNPSYINYGELRFSKSPAALMEFGFHDNGVDGPALDDVDFQQSVAVGIRNGLQTYFGNANPDPVFPQAPQVLSPGGADPGPTLTDSPLTFSWQGVQGATRYGLYISKAPYGQDNLVYSNENIAPTLTSLQISRSAFRQPGVTQYRWNMTAFNGPGDTQNGDFSQRLYFSLPLAPAGPVLSSLTMSSDGRIFAVWAEVLGVLNYNFQATFDGNPIEVSGIAPAQSSPTNGAVAAFIQNPEAPDKQNKLLCLSIRANNAGGESVWSDFTCVHYRYYTGIQVQSTEGLSKILLGLKSAR